MSAVQKAYYCKFRVLYCHMHNIWGEAAIGNEILGSQAPSNNAQTVEKKKIRLFSI